MNRTNKKTAVLRVRCEPSLKQEVRQVAILKHLDDSDIIRIATQDYIQRFKTAAAGSV
jgi:hypothetical protein